MTSREERVAALEGRFSIEDAINGNGRWNVLIVDDLFHSGATMEAACEALRTYAKAKGIYVASATW